MPYDPLTMFSIGPLHVRVWGLLVAAGLALGAWVTVRRGRRDGLPEDCLWTLVLVVGLAGVLGSRVLWALQPAEFADTLAHPLKLVAVWEGGLTFIGGLLAATSAGVVYARHARLPVARVADLAAYGFGPGLALGRLACFVTGLHPGRETTLPWGIEFLGAVRHPIPLYESLLGLALFLLAHVLLRRKPFPGLTALVIAAGYLVGRALLDTLRVAGGPGSDPRFVGSLTLTQAIAVVAVPLLAGGAFAVLRATRTGGKGTFRKPPPARTRPTS